VDSAPIGSIGKRRERFYELVKHLDEQLKKEAEEMKKNAPKPRRK
jgi:hypothetical protein